MGNLSLRQHWESHYSKYGVKTIWNWGKDSGLRPCPVYLRHCVVYLVGIVEVQKMIAGPVIGGAGGLRYNYNSFLGSTYI